MSAIRTILVLCICLAGTAVCGCVDLFHSRAGRLAIESGYYSDLASRIVSSDEDIEQPSAALNTQPPRTIRRPREEELRDMTLAQAIEIGLANSKIILTRGEFRARGSTLMNNPEGVNSIYDLVIRDTGILRGQRGTQAALADFDPFFSSSMLWGRQEQVQNNRFLSGGLNPGDTLKDETAEFRAQLEKQMGTGGLLILSHGWDYSLNNVPVRLFGSSYTGWMRADYRHPLLAGAGSEFTDIAGPIFRSGYGAAGINQGIVIVRINNDISILDFEAAVRDMLKDIEDLYWELALAFRAYDAAVIAQNSARKTWQATIARSNTGLKGGATADVSLARENFFESLANAEHALADLYARETELRRMLNLPVNDGRVIRPIDDPLDREFQPDWDVALSEALTRRIELKQQKARIKSLLLQCKAAKSLTRPRLDFVSGYQVNAFGDRLLSSSDNDGVTPHGLRSGYGTLFQGDQAGWNLGVEFSVPIGRRQAESQVRNLEMRLLKARSALASQEMEISHELGTAFQSIDRWHKTARSNWNRLQATETRIKALEADFNANRTSLDLLLRAYAARAGASIEYYRSLTEYNKAVAEVHYRKGTLLAYNNVQMSEGLWEPAEISQETFSSDETDFSLRDGAGGSQREWSDRSLSFGRSPAGDAASQISPDDFETGQPLMKQPATERESSEDEEASEDGTSFEWVEEF